MDLGTQAFRRLPAGQDSTGAHYYIFHSIQTTGGLTAGLHEDWQACLGLLVPVTCIHARGGPLCSQADALLLQPCSRVVLCLMLRAGPPLSHLQASACTARRRCRRWSQPRRGQLTRRRPPSLPSSRRQPPSQLPSRRRLLHPSSRKRLPASAPLQQPQLALWLPQHCSTAAWCRGRHRCRWRSCRP